MVNRKDGVTWHGLKHAGLMPANRLNTSGSREYLPGRLSRNCLLKAGSRNTFNNWIYPRSASKRIDVFSFFLDTMRDDFISDGYPTDKVQLFFADREIIVLWAMMWMLLEEKPIRGWYLAAFEKYGKTAKITDMYRTGKIWCTCPNVTAQSDRWASLMNQ